MVRAPCCEKMGLNKGPWTSEEDRILINYINLHGHSNWRALPKQAGLLRCGKSCRLRWINYLRPDIKRGNFSQEEEDTIIELHGMLGNKWSAIAARLPGRTDNEIKNVWHTHLKKRVQQNQAIPVTEQPKSTKTHIQDQFREKEPQPTNYPNELRMESPQHSSCETSSSAATTTTATASMGADELDNFPEADESFWSDVFSGESSEFPAAGADSQAQLQFSPVVDSVECVYGYDLSMRDDMGFWYNLFARAGEFTQMPDF